MKKKIIVFFLSVVYMFAADSNNINILIKQLQKIQQVLQKKEKEEKKISKKQFYENRLDLISLKLNYLKNYQEYLQEYNLNRKHLIKFIKNMDNALINFYKHQVFYLNYIDRIKINGKYFYVLNGSDWSNIITQVEQYKEKIKELNFEKKSLNGLTKDSLNNLIIEKFTALSNNTLVNNTNSQILTVYTQNIFLSPKKTPFEKIKEMGGNVLYLEGIE